MEGAKKEEARSRLKEKGLDTSENERPSKNKASECADPRVAMIGTDGPSSKEGINQMPVASKKKDEGQNSKIPWKGKKSFAEIIAKGTDVEYRKTFGLAMEKINMEEKGLSFSRSAEMNGAEQEPIFDISDADKVLFGNRFSWVIKGLCKPLKPPLEEIHQEAANIVGGDCYLQVEAINRWEIIIRFSYEANYLRILSKNFVHVKESAIRLFQWSPTLYRRLDLRKAQMAWNQEKETLIKF